jgi:PhzF family phenazine biosynthesis protein
MPLGTRDREEPGTMELDYAVVDVFTDARYSGNPAAVVLGAESLSDRQMAAIAREFNLSETTFVLPSDSPDAAVRFRWFTPGAEVDLCGHATLAGVHTLLEQGRFSSLTTDPDALLPIQTRSGTLTSRVDALPNKPNALLIWLDLPKPKLTPARLNTDQLARLLGATLADVDRSLPVMKTQDDDLILFVHELVILQGLEPDFAQLARLCTRHRIRGVCVASLQTLADSVHVQSRFFAPAVGVAEDPVTGSVHGPLATYLVVNELVPFVGNTAAVNCLQAEAGGRAGTVRALVTQHRGEGYAVRIAGQCMTTMQGRLVV